MAEIDKFGAYKTKLENICEENNLTFLLKTDRYPITLTIKPLTGMDAQMTMFEGDGEYRNENSYLMFIYEDGAVAYKTSDTFNISETLFNKLKNLFKNLHSMWLQYYFRETISSECVDKSCLEDVSEDDPAYWDDEAEDEWPDEDCPPEDEEKD